MQNIPNRAILEPTAYQALFEMCMEALPHEACGVLTGHLTAGDSDSGSLEQPAGMLHITGVHRVANIANHPEKQFSFDPHDWVQVLYRIQKNRQSLVGFFHSHPSSPPVPSAADRSGFLPHDGSTSYWIVSTHEQRRELIIQPYWVQGSLFHPLMLAQISV